MSKNSSSRGKSSETYFEKSSSRTVESSSETSWTIYTFFGGFASICYFICFFGSFRIELELDIILVREDCMELFDEVDNLDYDSAD